LKIDKTIMVSMFSFSSWTLLGSLSVVALSQGIAILVNIFFGVIANASLGLSDQVLAAITRVTGNFQTAFNPQIIKSYASGNFEYLKKLISQSSKLSYFLVLLAVVPLYVDAGFILSIWLGHVPEYLVSLVRVVAIYILIDCISGPFVTVIYAVGKLKRYQIIISLIMAANLLFAYFMVTNEVPLYIVVMARVTCVSFLLVYRLFFVSYLIDFDLKEYTKVVISRLLLVGVGSFIIVGYINELLEQSFMGLSLLLVLSTFTIALLFYIVAFTQTERNYCKVKVNFFLSKLVKLKVKK
ncbi:TPA: hypothetical protein QH834_005413, partial [Klebsiella pneumoniae subsp. pneumoniae]|nr:hypothetical protein [Klebsiella pneumoniae subsp. pneumoniae]